MRITKREAFAIAIDLLEIELLNKLVDNEFPERELDKLHTAKAMLQVLHDELPVHVPMTFRKKGQELVVKLGDELWPTCIDVVSILCGANVDLLLELEGTKTHGGLSKHGKALRQVHDTHHAELLDAIVAKLDGTHWDSETISEIANLLADAGYEIHDARN